MSMVRLNGEIVTNHSSRYELNKHDYFMSTSFFEQAVARHGNGKGDLSIPLPKGMAEGEHLEVVVRPEDIHASEAPPEGEHNILEGTIDLMNFQGGYSECFVYSGGLRLRCIVHQSMKANRGDKIWLTVDPQHCVVFPGSQSRGKAES